MEQSRTGATVAKGPVVKMGFRAGQAVQEFGYDDDVDDAFRADVEQLVGSQILDPEEDDVVDVVLLWWRDDDGDLVDGVVDVLPALSEGGTLWVLTPKSGRDGFIEASDVDDAATTSGLHVTSRVAVGPDWSAARMVAPKNARRG